MPLPTRIQWRLSRPLILATSLLLVGCGSDGTEATAVPPADEARDTEPTPADWLVRWGDYSVGPWTTDQLLADCARGRFSPEFLAWNPELPDWKPLGTLFPDVGFGGSREDGRRWSRLIERMNDSHDVDQSDAFWSQFIAATGQETATPFVPTRQRGAKLQAWRARVRPMVEQALELRGRFGPEDTLDGGGVNGSEAMRNALVLDASDAIAKGDRESALQALECLAGLGRQMSHGLFGLYSAEAREIDGRIGDESMTWRAHEDLNLRQGITPLVNINGVLGTWKDWRTDPEAVERLAGALDWVPLEEVERLHRLRGTRSIRNDAPGWRVEDRARRHRELVLLIEGLRDSRR